MSLSFERRAGDAVYNAMTTHIQLQLAGEMIPGETHVELKTMSASLPCNTPLRVSIDAVMPRPPHFGECQYGGPYASAELGNLAHSILLQLFPGQQFMENIASLHINGWYAKPRQTPGVTVTILALGGENIFS